MFEASIILLNGASSSGKTSIVSQLQRIMPEPYIHISVDRNHETFPHHCWDFETIDDIEVDRFISGYHACVATLAKYGNRVIFDTVLASDFDVEECSRLFCDHKVFYIHVDCSLSVLQEREKFRGDRIIGLAASQVEQVSDRGPFDFHVDTTNESSERCAEQIRDFILACFSSEGYISKLSYNNSINSQP